MKYTRSQLCARAYNRLLMQSSIDTATPATATKTRRDALHTTAVYYLAFAAFGMTGGLLGPSMSGLAAHTGGTFAAISTIFIGSAIGRLIGSLNAGRMLDRNHGHRLIAGAMLLVALTIFCIPLTGSLPVLTALLFVFGLAVNTLDVGGNTLIVRLHGKAVAPYMNGLHLVFGIGASLAPLLIGRSYALSGDINAAFVIAAVLIIVMALWLSRRPTPQGAKAGGSAADSAVPLSHVILMGAFFFCMVGIEILGSQWTFNMGVSLGLNRESGAPLLASMFWWMYALGRLISIPLAMRIGTGKYLLIDLIGMLLSSVVLLLGLRAGNGANPWVWAGVIGIGLSVASTFPGALSYIGERMRMTGKITGGLFASANIGAMFIPWFIGQTFEPLGPVVVPLTGLALSLAGIAIFVAMSRTLGQPG